LGSAKDPIVSGATIIIMAELSPEKRAWFCLGSFWGWHCLVQACKHLLLTSKSFLSHLDFGQTHAQPRMGVHVIQERSMRVELQLSQVQTLGALCACMQQGAAQVAEVEASRGIQGGEGTLGRPRKSYKFREFS
jgi:tRNA(Ile2) C34 agmatinyltransferase TiaS